MGKINKQPGTWLEREMLESKAYLALRGFAPQLLSLIYLKRKFDRVGTGKNQKHICTNCDKLNITYTEFKSKYGISQPRMTRAIDQLLAKGFLSIVYSGGTYRQDKAVYSLSTNWVIWQPEIVFETRKKESLKRGFCNPKKEKSHTKP